MCLYGKSKTTCRSCWNACCSRRTSLNLAADVFRLSEVSGPSDYDEQRVFMQSQVVVCGRSAPRLLLDLPLQHPAGRHVGNLWLGVMSSKKPDSAFYYREMTAGLLECRRVWEKRLNYWWHVIKRIDISCLFIVVPEVFWWCKSKGNYQHVMVEKLHKKYSFREVMWVFLLEYNIKRSK